MLKCVRVIHFLARKLFAFFRSWKATSSSADQGIHSVFWNTNIQRVHKRPPLVLSRPDGSIPCHPNLSNIHFNIILHSQSNAAL
jgi:hypothetical protein